MDWMNLFGNGILLGTMITIVEIIRDWKTKKNKDNVDVKKTDYEAQKQGLDLVQEFYNKVKQVTEDQNTKLFERFEKTDKSINEIVEYLNGDFDKWKKEHENI